MKIFGMVAMAAVVAAEVYSNGVRYFGSGAAGVSPLLKLALLLPFVWLLLESRKVSTGAGSHRSRRLNMDPSGLPARTKMPASGIRR